MLWFAKSQNQKLLMRFVSRTLIAFVEGTNTEIGGEVIFRCTFTKTFSNTRSSGMGWCEY